MRYVDRSAIPIPDTLGSADGLGAKELIKARAHYAANPRPKKAFEFEAYREPDVKQALRNLFHNKCAYCESFIAGTQPEDVEHYRPKGGIEGHARHPGYWWLATVWTNLLPSCIDCNRRRGQVMATADMSLEELQAALRALQDTDPGGKQNAFPTLDNVWADAEVDPETCEQPALIDPTRTDPMEHLVWSEADVPVVIPVEGEAGEPCSRAVTSVHVYALNRIGLVQARAEVLQMLQAQLESIRDLMDAAGEAAPAQKTRANSRLDRAVARLRRFSDAKHEYSAMAYAVIARFDEELVLWQAQQPEEVAA